MIPGTDMHSDAGDFYATVALQYAGRMHSDAGDSYAGGYYTPFSHIRAGFPGAGLPSFPSAFGLFFLVFRCAVHFVFRCAVHSS